MDYYDTLTTLKKMGIEGKLTRFTEKNQGYSVRKTGRGVIHSRFILYAVAASLLLAGFIVLFQVSEPQRSQPEFVPLASLEYPVERSSEVQGSVTTVVEAAYSMALQGAAEDGINSLANLLASQDHSAKEEIEIHFAIARIHYNMQQFEDAEERLLHLLQIADLEVYEEEQVYWYLANLKLNLSERDEALVFLQKVIEMDGAYSRMAGNTLQAVRQ